MNLVLKVYLWRDEVTISVTTGKLQSKEPSPSVAEIPVAPQLPPAED